MKTIFHRDFEKDFKKLRSAAKEKARTQLRLFAEDPFNPILGNHPLKGKWKGYSSIDVGGDLRAIYKIISDDACLFTAIGTHAKLYGL